MDIDYLKGKKIAILGLGVEGVALAKFLVGKACSITLLDVLSKDELLSRAEEESNSELTQTLNNEDSYQFVLGDNYINNLTDFDIVFRAPGVPYLNSKIQEAKNEGVEISSQIKLFFDLCSAKIVGVTGTKGKGTTASLIKSILDSKKDGEVYLAGNIGKPAITLLPKIKSEDVVVLELSSFQLQDLYKSPHIAVIVNLSIDHLDYHKDEEEYREAKKSIFKFQNENDYLVVNSKIGENYYQESKAKRLLFSGYDEDGGEAKVSDGEGEYHQVSLNIDGSWTKVIASDEIKLVGDHNLENIAAAALVAKTLGVEMAKIQNGIKSFEGLPHRLELVEEIEGVRYFNDSFATNPEPTIAAINAFSENKILILGGSSKGADFSDLASKISSSNVAVVILIGDEAEKIESSLMKKKYSGKIEKAEDLEEVLNRARENAETGEVVIFSPACASFDMFKNYKDRGEQFKNAVLKLVKS